jgi:hypothetical protein
MNNLKQEFIRTAQFLFEKESRPLHIGLTGGTNSLAVAFACVEAKVPFHCVIFSYSERNFFDVHKAFDFCKAKGWSYENRQIDPSTLLKDPKELITRWGVSDPREWIQNEVFMTYPDQLVIGRGWPHLFLNEKNLSWSVGDSTVSPSDRIDYFFSSRPELREALIRSPLVEKWKTLSQKYKFSSTLEWRETILRSIWPDFVSPPSWHGFEAYSGSWSKWMSDATETYEKTKWGCL